LTANYSSCAFCFFHNINPNPNGPPNFVNTLVTGTASTNNVGTFGQYSVGVSGSIKDTGWLGFARVDYRAGPEMHGLSATGGIRYQFTPTAAAALPVKAKAPVDYPVDWRGWYVGVVGGATEFGHSSTTFPG